ncbi:toxin-antitoxin system, antitoxin component, Xre family [Mycobacterium parascrofulaceum ATCC BAA-614]|uniref:Toxin-antitoxin system, antitoxin component, Xre family n=1 Tax=Mycobacterium parascrofulaceum ATCC BAA-614 TaxID=525368 RepID=D5P5G0_9MYCO|nr:toxin-antitoxin system, antitoxin component, Xre family [Mycobacterium parascrofulaceum ATCC BAA-614]
MRVEGCGSAPEQAGGASKDSDLAVKLNKLFEIMRKPTEPPLSNAAAAEAITKATGVSISSAYIWQLRNGIKTNPTVQHLRAIADFFGVPASYLIDRDTDQQIEAQLTLIQAIRDSGVRDLALRTAGLTPEAISSLAAIVDQVRKLHGLPPMAPAESADRDDI